jgi:two-component system cell cycle sensor histidine kinase PleC
MAKWSIEHVRQDLTGPDPNTVARRKSLIRDVKSVREKLTSATGLVRAFDHELVRMYAQQHISGAPAIVLLAVGVATTASLWVTPVFAAAWLAAMILATLLGYVLCQRFLNRADLEDHSAITAWRRLLPAAEALHGLTWALILVLFIGNEEPGAKMFVLTTLLMVSALTVMIGSPMPAAVYAGLVPVAGGMGLLLMAGRDMDSFIVSAMGGGALLFLVFLANRLYSNNVAALEFRAEKDALIAELETAKSNSDEARRKAEEANLAKSRFLATMSHELRTPLNAILGFSEVMKGEVFGPHSNESYKEYSSDIHSSGQHLLNLINEILDLSRIEAGKYELKEEAVSLAAVVEDAHHMLKLRAKAKSQTIREMVEPDLPRVWADERAIRQIVLNLLTNAIKFTPQGGEITIKAGWTASGGQYVSVVDSGPGIPEEELPTVMESFGRGSLALKTAEQGTGLGLPIVKGLVELHGGVFNLNSRLRIGTEVTFTIPAERVMDTLPAVHEGPASPLTQRYRAA